jgi:hypothetical protein
VHFAERRAVDCDGLGDVATTQPRLVVARLADNGR